STDALPHAAACTSSAGLAVFTSGGDSQGMNSAIRAAMIGDGEDGQEIDQGAQLGPRVRHHPAGRGTVIGSARSARFRTREGATGPARNLIRRGITNLVVVIGGDGSLTEWPSLVDELLKEGASQRSSGATMPACTSRGWSVHRQRLLRHRHDHRDGLGLHRIIEACDASPPPRRAISVMGRHCGYLALVSPVLRADFLFIPEEASGTDGRCDARQRGKRTTPGSPSSATYSVAVPPSAFDRLLGCRMAAGGRGWPCWTPRQNPELPSIVVSLDANQVLHRRPAPSASGCRAVNEAIQAKNYAQSVELRRQVLHHNLAHYATLKKLHSPRQRLQRQLPDAAHRDGRRPRLRRANLPACAPSIAPAIAIGSAVGRQRGFDGSSGPLLALSWESVSGLTSSRRQLPRTKRITAEERHRR
uniref:6-phosphofructokinase n=1 Tax=Macrostomum lignano TaxID=282301 RepID=A0A1I8FB16_9PLAT